MKITLYGRLVSDPLMQLTVYCSCAGAVPAGLVLKQQNSPYWRSQRYVNDRLLYKLAKSGQLIKIVTSVLHSGCDSLQWVQRRILHAHVVVTCFCSLSLVIVSEQFLFVQATILRGHDVKWSFFWKENYRLVFMCWQFSSWTRQKTIMSIIMPK